MPILADSRDCGARRTHMPTDPAGVKFLDAKANEEGVIKLDSGLLYKARGWLFTKFTDCQSSGFFEVL